MRRLFLVSVLTAASLYACSEATDGLVGYDVVWTVPEAGADGAPASSSSGATKPALVVDAASISTGVVLLNELSASAEWVEIVNSGNAAVDIGGWQVTDRDKTTGGPKEKDLVAFPDGTTIAPSAYALVKGGGADSGEPCPGGGTAVCLHADFGISNKSGETIFLLATDGGVLGTAVYPPDAADGDDQSWGRVPSGDPNGQFALTAATPGAPNSAPSSP